MARANWLVHKGKRIFHIDFSKTDNEGIKQAIEESKPIINKQPKDSILCLVDVTGTKVTMDISSAIKDFTMHNKPFMRMTAVTGIEGIQKVVLNAAIVFTKRTNLIIKNSVEEAMDWLAEQ